MQNLITTGNTLTMSSREIAELVDARHNDVIATIERLFSKGLLRSSRISRREATGGRPLQVYDLCERDTHLVVAGYSDEHRAKVIDRWQELESMKAPALPSSFAEALRLAADQAERIEKQETMLALAAPKVEFVDRYVENTGTMTFRQVAKLLRANERHLRQLLIDGHVMYRLNGVMTPYQNHIDAGRFELKTGTSERNNHAFAQARFTPKGVQWIAGLWASHSMQEAA
jgi:phage antirepressor YoqD-like protein